MNGLPAAEKQVVRTAMSAAGYHESLIRENVPLFLDHGPEHEAVSLPVVAFWGEPADQFTSAIAVTWLDSDRPAHQDLRNTTAGLWAPFTVIASPKGFHLWETLPEGPLGSMDPFRKLAEGETRDLPALFARTSDQIGPGAVRDRKRPWRQTALYEASPEHSAFFEWAYKPTRDRLERVFARLLRETLALGLDRQESEADCLRWTLRMLGARLVWDKKWTDQIGSRTSAEDLLRAALSYPTPLGRVSGLRTDTASELAMLVTEHLAHIDLSTADGALLGQVIQGGALPTSLQKKWNLYPTPPDIAWRMLQDLPIETLPRAERRVWDGTCGTGTFLAAAVDVLRALAPDLEGVEIRDYLVASISGNEREPTMADTTRIALDQALGAPAGAEWHITERDVHNAVATLGPDRPTIIVGNPLFRGGGRGEEIAAGIIDDYLKELPEGGMMAIVTPRTMLATDSGLAVRKHLLEETNILEAWELPGKVFRRTDTETAVLVVVRRFRADVSSDATTWRVLSADRQEQWIGAVDQQDWAKAPRRALRAPLAMRLEALFEQGPKLRNFVPNENRTQGITPGSKATSAGDVLDETEPGAEPYLVGRTGMLPFYISWDRHRRWIRDRSPRLQWPRRDYASLFRGPKVLVSRHATHGATWRVRAAVEKDGLFPSDQFVALRPEPPLTLDLVAGILNSILANAWLRLVNPAFSLRIDDLLTLPVPSDLGSSEVKVVEGLSRELAVLWAHLAEAELSGHRHVRDNLELARTLTFDLDQAVYTLYRVPLDVQYEIGTFLKWLGGNRPGFKDPAIQHPDRPTLPMDECFGERDSARLGELFTERDESGLTAAQEEELEHLLWRWQRAETSSLGPGPRPLRQRTHSGEPSLPIAR